jgi:hypothetical protein
MKSKRVLITVIVVALAVGAGFLVHRWMTPRNPAICQICGRGIPQQTEFRIETPHGTLHACCPRCALHHVLHHPGEARKEFATDLNTGRMIAAQSAYYDEGGDVQYCTAHHSAVERTPMGVEVRTYDRCLPVMVAFTSRKEAEAYRQQHGGRVVTYQEALEELTSARR